MPSYTEWTVVSAIVNNKTEVNLLIDGKFAKEYFSAKAKKELSPAQHSLLPISSEVTSVLLLPGIDSHIQISLGKTSVKLLGCRFKKTILFGKPIEDVTDLVEFWRNIGGFLQWDPPPDDIESEEEKTDSLELFHDKGEEQEPDLSTSLDLFDSNSQCTSDNSGHEAPSSLESSVAEIHDDIDPCNDQDQEEQQEVIKREHLFSSIGKKMVAFKIIDIFSLHPPPPTYRVREVDRSFVKNLTAKMIEKNSVSVENAPTIIGFVDVELADFEISQLTSLKIYVIDGNDSIQAQKAAYRQTKDEIFRHRGVNIYCKLTEDEALFLGISRNEDTSSFVKFNDYQKVDLIRRKLYSMTNTSLEKEPPKPPKDFKDVFACMLNLKEKKAVDGKNIIRFLACLPNDCYALYKSICARNQKIPASKFSCLRGLSNINAYSCLLKLSQTELQKEDWYQFISNCMKKQEKGRRHRKEVTAVIEFSEKSTKIFINHKLMPGGCLCFKFIDNKEEITLISSDLKDLVFGSTKKKSVALKDFSDGKAGQLKQHTANWLFHKTKTSEIDLTDEESDVDKEIAMVVPESPEISENEEILANIDTERAISDEESKESMPSLAKLQSFGETSSSSRHCSTPVRDFEKVVNLPTSAEVSSFLYKMADDDAARRAENGTSLIEEDEVETKPEELLENCGMLLDPHIQNLAKKYFCDDAWMLVINTLKTLEERYAVNTCKKIFTYTGKGKCLADKGKGPAGSGKGVRSVYSFSSEESISPVKLLSGKQRKRPQEEDAKKQGIKQCKIRLTDIGSVKNINKYLADKK